MICFVKGEREIERERHQANVETKARERKGERERDEKKLATYSSVRCPYVIYAACLLLRDKTETNAR